MGVYCLALVPSNTLPKTPLGGIHLSETKQLFLEGALHPCNVLMCPHTCVTNLPKPRQKQPGTNVLMNVGVDSVFEVWDNHIKQPQVKYVSLTTGNMYLRAFIQEMIFLSHLFLFLIPFLLFIFLLVLLRDRSCVCDGRESGVGEEDRSGQRQGSGSDRRQWPGKEGVCERGSAGFHRHHHKHV